MGPRLSVLLPALEGFESVAAALDAWLSQTARDELEVLVLCPDAALVRPLPDGVRAIALDGLGLAGARARGVREAAGEFVVVAEDHCLPDPDAVEHMLETLDAGWDVVAPALRSADPRRESARAAFVIGYGQWLEPVSAGPRASLPGHNTAIRRTVLEAIGDLDDAFTSGSFLVARLLAQGCRGYLDPRIRMRHFDRPAWAAQLRLFAYVGLGFGAIRTRRLPVLLRLLYPLAVPAVIARHYARSARELARRPGYPPTRLGVAVLSLVWGAFEGVGAVAGVGRARRAIELTEIKPVSRADVARADAAARSVHVDFRGAT